MLLEAAAGAAVLGGGPHAMTKLAGPRNPQRVVGCMAVRMSLLVLAVRCYEGSTSSAVRSLVMASGLLRRASSTSLSSQEHSTANAECALNIMQCRSKSPTMQCSANFRILFGGYYLEVRPIWVLWGCTLAYSLDTDG